MRKKTRRGLFWMVSRNKIDEIFFWWPFGFGLKTL